MNANFFHTSEAVILIQFAANKLYIHGPNVMFRQLIACANALDL